MTAKAAQERTTFPGIEKVPWYAKELPLALLGDVPLVITALVAAFQAEKAIRYVLFGVACWTFLFLIVRAVSALRKDKKRRKEESPDDLVGCLLVLYNAIEHCVDIGDLDDEKRRLRITVYRIDGETLEQCTSYVGGVGGKPGRKMSIRTGIVGHVARTGKTYSAKRTSEDHQGFVAELVSDWHFTRAEAEQILADRQSWLAVPVFGTSDSAPIAVVFMDSSERDMFAPEIQGLIVGACGGLARYAKLRYTEQ